MKFETEAAAHEYWLKESLRRFRVAWSRDRTVVHLVDTRTGYRRHYATPHEARNAARELTAKELRKERDQR